MAQTIVLFCALKYVISETEAKIDMRIILLGAPGAGRGNQAQFPDG